MRVGDFVKRARRWMTSIGDALMQDASTQPYVMRGELVNACWKKYSEAEALLQLRKDRISAETKAVGGTRTVAKRPVDVISELGTGNVSEVAVVEPLSPVPTTIVRREPERLPTLSAISMADFDEVGALMA